MTSGWDQLLCPYFFSVASHTLGTYFRAQGFILKQTKIGGLLCERSGLFVEVDYVPETFPNYEVTVVVGLGDAKYDQQGAFTGVPAWYVIPDDSAARKYSLWGFSSENRLAIVLGQIQVEVLQKFIEPLLARTDVLEEVIDRFRSDNR